MRLTDDQHNTLRALSGGVGYANEACRMLAEHGLVDTGKSRFGYWARITKAGQQHLELHPVAAPGPANAGDPPRVSTARKRRNVEPVRPAPTGFKPVIRPPAVALGVGAASPKRRRKPNGA